MFKEVLSEPIVNENHIAERRTARRRRFDLRRIKPIRNSFNFHVNSRMGLHKGNDHIPLPCIFLIEIKMDQLETVSYTHLRAHETGRNLVCRLLLEKKKK